MLPDELPHTCTIKRPRHVQGQLGGDTPDLADHETGVGCWIQPAKASTINEYRRRDQNVSHSVYFSEEPDLLPGDWILPEAGSFRAGHLMRFVALAGAGAGVLELYRAEFYEDREAPDMPDAADGEVE